MPITPDTKDWTWVLARTCSECGFDVRTFPRSEVGDLIRKTSASWKEALQGERVRERRSEDRWSTLEYGCHVRDVFRLYDERLHLMLQQDNPTFPNWDQDATAAAENYGAQDPSVVGDELSDAATVLAERFDQLSQDQWERKGERSDGASFDVESFARYMIHDPIHHLHDVDAPTS